MKKQLQNSKEKTSPRNNLWEGEYQISQTSYYNDETQDSYEKKIRLILETVTDSSYNFLYSEFDFQKNGETSDSKASELAKMCMEIIYPLRFIVDFQGKLQKIELIKNIQQISTEIDEIKQFFEDEFSSDYIEKLKKIIKNPKEFSEKFEKTLLNTLLFNSIYKQNFDPNRINPAYNGFFLWISNANSILFEIHNTISDDDNQQQETVKIIQKGISIDYRTYEELYYLDFENDENNLIKDASIDCEFVAEYNFDKNNKSLQRIEATFQNFVDDNIEKEMFLLERIS